MTTKSEPMFELFDNAKRKKTRLIVQKGIENIALKIEDIALIYTENKLVFVVAKDERKYLCDRTLTELEDLLDNTVFFRANRQYIINVDYIRGFKTFEKVKLQVDLTFSPNPHKIIISQETAPHFKKWIYEA